MGPVGRMEIQQGKERIKVAYKDKPQKYIDAYQDNFKEYPHQRIRLDIVLDRIKKFKINTVLDVGCGSCYPLSKLLKEGYNVTGFDINDFMVKKGKELLRENKQDPDRVFLNTIENIDGLYDCIINLGAFPHAENQKQDLKSHAKLLNQNGKLFIEMRNELFAFFTFNKYSYNLFQKLIPNMPPHVEKFFKKTFRLDLPREIDPYYISDPKLNNPFELGPLFRNTGLKINHIHYYHYHFVPPMFEHNVQDFDTYSLNIEKPNAWQGCFMASAFLVEATKC